MHKGRVYPFAQEFWLITSQFWQGFIPWKAKIIECIFAGPGNAYMGDPSIGHVSNAIEVISLHNVRYTWPITWYGSGARFVIDLEDYMHDGILYVRWHAQIFQGVTLIDEAYNWAPSPRYTFDSPVGFWYQEPDYPGVNYSMTGSFLYATYAEGGSPYS
jgi:hypothetical protein